MLTEDVEEIVTLQDMDSVELYNKLGRIVQDLDDIQALAKLVVSTLDPCEDWSQDVEHNAEIVCALGRQITHRAGSLRDELSNDQSDLRTKDSNRSDRLERLYKAQQRCEVAQLSREAAQRGCEAHGDEIPFN